MPRRARIAIAGIPWHIKTQNPGQIYFPSQLRYP
jgi:hypothetical protein